jgi:hypothetical protein
MLLLPRESRLEGFGSFDTGGDEDIGGQGRILLAQRMIGAVVQFHAILFVLLPAIGTHGIEDFRPMPARAGVATRRIVRHARTIFTRPVCRIVPR